MTYEEAKKVIYEMICLGLLTSKEDEALHMAYQAIEKQIPKKPTNINYIIRPYGVVDLKPFMATCTCGKFVTAHSDYCQYCGQTLDWRNTNTRAI